MATDVACMLPLRGYPAKATQCLDCAGNMQHTLHRTGDGPTDWHFDHECLRCGERFRDGGLTGG